MTEEYIEHPIVDNLQDHSIQLKEIKRVAKNIMKKFDREKQFFPRPTQENIEAMQYVLNKCLRKVADLSMSRGEIQTQLNDHYTKTFINNPALGKKLFLEHYFNLHKPYDKIKDYLWKSIFILKEYHEKHF